MVMPMRMTVIVMAVIRFVTLPGLGSVLIGLLARASRVTTVVLSH